MVIQCKHKKDPWFVYEKLALKTMIIMIYILRVINIGIKLSAQKRLLRFHLKKFEKFHIINNFLENFMVNSILKSAFKSTKN